MLPDFPFCLPHRPSLCVDPPPPQTLTVPAPPAPPPAVQTLNCIINQQESQAPPFDPSDTDIVPQESANHLRRTFTLRRTPPLLPLLSLASSSDPRCSSFLPRMKTKMGNCLACPFQSMSMFSCCFSSGGHIEDGGLEAYSPRTSLCCGYGDYKPEFVRTILENNVLLGNVSFD